MINCDLPRALVHRQVSRWRIVEILLSIQRAFREFLILFIPVENEANEAKDVSYEQLDRAYTKLPAYNIKLVL